MVGISFVLRWLLLFCQITGIWAIHAHHSHEHLHQHFNRQNVASISVTVSSSSATTSTSPQFGNSDTATKVSEALKALAVVNKLRVDNVNFNRYSIANAKDMTRERINAPPLDYSRGAVSRLSALQNTSESESSKEKRQESTNTNSGFAYTIPKDLADTARALAESVPPTASTGEEEALVAKVHTKHRSKTKDTNRPPQRLQHLNGLFGYILDEQTVLQPSDLQSENSTLVKRAASGSNYWLANLQQNAASPFAPSGYKVTQLYLTSTFI